MIRCNYCNKNIQGHYSQYSNGTLICASCKKKLHSCALCNIPINKGKKRGKKYYCLSCFEKAIFCFFCGETVEGKYWKVDKKVICRKCNTSLPKCIQCNIPMKEFLTIKQGKICISCSNKIQHCASCQVPLLEDYFTFQGDNRPFCQECSKDGNRCSICTLPLTQKYIKLKDGRVICAVCKKTSVKTEAQARKILDKVLAYLKQNFNMKIRKTTKLHLVDSKTLIKIRKKHSKDFGGKDRRALGYFLRKGDSFEVYIENMLPYSLCLAVLAHEYAHAWQADHFPPKASILYIEGFAEWISYRTLLHYKYKKEAFKISKQKDIYGQGFKKIYALETKYGVQNVIKKVLKIINRK